MPDLDRGKLLRLFRYLPALALLPLLTRAIPTAHGGVREIASFYQSLALIQTGIDSFTFITLQETDAGLHLYSMLAAPLVAGGYLEAGRLVSAVAAVMAAISLGFVAGELYGDNGRLLAVPALFLNAYFFRYAWSLEPEALSVALTVGCVAATLRYVSTDNRRYFIVSMILLILGILNHSWEATIALPVVAILWYEDKLTKIPFVTGITLATVGWFV